MNILLDGQVRMFFAGSVLFASYLIVSLILLFSYTVDLFVGGMSTSERLVCPLRDCLLFKPGSCVEDVFDALKHGGISDINLCGDFVRAEGRSLDPMGRKRQLGRDVVISEGCCVLRIQTNRKSMWQHSFHQQLVTQEHE